MRGHNILVDVLQTLKTTHQLKTVYRVLKILNCPNKNKQAIWLMICGANYINKDEQFTY